MSLAQKHDKNRRRTVTTAIEHKSILIPCKKLENLGFEIILLPVNSDGVIDHETAEKEITDKTLLVSIQAASNEIGTIQLIKKLANIAHERGAFFHCDAAQAIGKIPVDIATWDFDLLSISAHKLYGPKGVGALYVRNGPFSLPIKPLLFGGGQEKNLRPGTLNVPGIVGFGEACKLCTELMPTESARIENLRDRLEENLLSAIPNTRRNGALHQRLPNNSSLTFPGIDAEALIVNTPHLAISTGSACTTGAPEPSHVLEAIGLSRDEAYSTIRIGLGRFSTDNEIEITIASLIKAHQRLKSLSNKY